MDQDAILKQLRNAISTFDHEGVKEAAALAKRSGMDAQLAINEGLVKGLFEVEEKYKRDEYFLPDLIMAGEALNEAVKVILNDQSRNPSGRHIPVIIATVAGDIHDIGKNILKNLLQGIGIHVIDLGVNVGSQEIAGAVEKHAPAVLALSSLLSTSRREIQKSLKAIEKKGLRNQVRVIIGGGSTNRLHARMARADAYAKDAPEGVKIIKRWIENLN